MPGRTEASALGVWVGVGRRGRERRLVLRPWPPEDQAERPADLGGLCWRLSLASDGQGTSSRPRPAWWARGLSWVLGSVGPNGRQPGLDGGEPPLDPLDLPHQKLPTRLVLSGRQGECPPVGSWTGSSVNSCSSRCSSRRYSLSRVGIGQDHIGQGAAGEPPGNRLKGMGRALEVAPSGSYVPLPLCRRAPVNAAP
jgi:hypothetical protein